MAIFGDQAFALLSKAPTGMLFTAKKEGEMFSLVHSRVLAARGIFLDHAMPSRANLNCRASG